MRLSFGQGVITNAFNGLKSGKIEINAIRPDLKELIFSGSQRFDT